MKQNVGLVECWWYKPFWFFVLLVCSPRRYCSMGFVATEKYVIVINDVLLKISDHLRSTRFLIVSCQNSIALNVLLTLIMIND